MSDATSKNRTDPQAHKRYLEYRDRHSYFGRTEKILSLEAFVPLELELAQLDSKGEDARDDEEQARFDELARILFRD
jgi:hypothetical protein